MNCSLCVAECDIAGVNSPEAERCPNYNPQSLEFSEIDYLIERVSILEEQVQELVDSWSRILRAIRKESGDEPL